MSGSGALRSCMVASIVVVLAIFHIETCAAKSLGLHEDFWPTENGSNKRNSWWSKKSVQSPSDYNQILKDSSNAFTIEDQESDDSDIDYGRDNISELYGCYITTCVPEFVRCAERSRSHSSALSQLDLRDSGSVVPFSRCRRNHQLCALECRANTV